MWLVIVYIIKSTYTLDIMVHTIMYTCIVTAQLPGKNGYSGGKVVFIDTENTL